MRFSYNASLSSQSFQAIYLRSDEFIDELDTRLLVEGINFDFELALLKGGTIEIFGEFAGYAHATITAAIEAELETWGGKL